MSLNSRSLAILLTLFVFPLSGCLLRTHRVQPPYSLASLKTSTKDDLLAYINSQAAKIQTMEATVDIDTAVGGEKKGKVTEYQEIRGYVFARQPAMLRMIGLFPIVRNRAFDMVSDGERFKVWLPTKNRFIVGKNNEVTPNPKQPLQNLRPNVIYDALLLHPIDPQTETAVFEPATETVPGEKGHTYERPDYAIDIIRGQGSATWLARKIVFSRMDLLPNRQLIYDESGKLVTDARYSNYQAYNGVQFPAVIEIRRPEEEYDITLHIVKMDMNLPLANDKFVLDQPAGAQVINLDGADMQPSAGGNQ